VRFFRAPLHWSTNQHLYFPAVRTFPKNPNGSTAIESPPIKVTCCYFSSKHPFSTASNILCNFEAINDDAFDVVTPLLYRAGSMYENMIQPLT
jgi:hypothetical protein